jgi:hypothetical protein
VPKKIPADVAKRAVELDGQGMPQEKIANLLGYRRETICRLIGRHYQRVYAQMAKSHAAERGRQLKWLHRMFRETWDEWQRSKAPFVGHRVSKPAIIFGAFGKPETVRAERTEKSRTGDPAYIDQLLKILAQQREVLMMNKVGKRDQKENSGAGDDDVTKALCELEALERKIRSGGGEQDDDLDDPDASGDRGKPGGGPSQGDGDQERGCDCDQDAPRHLGVRPPDWF